MSMELCGGASNMSSTVVSVQAGGNHAESALIPAADRGRVLRKRSRSALGGLNQERIEGVTIGRNFHQRQQLPGEPRCAAML